MLRKSIKLIPDIVFANLYGYPHDSVVIIVGGGGETLAQRGGSKG